MKNVDGLSVLQIDINDAISRLFIDGLSIDFILECKDLFLREVSLMAFFKSVILLLYKIIELLA